MKSRWSPLAENNGRTATSLRLDMEAIHQPFSAEQANPHSGVGNVFPVENFIQVRDALAFVPDCDDEHVLRIVLQNEFSSSTTAVLESIAGNLGDGGGNSGLVLSVELKCGRESTSFLPHQHDIIFDADVERKKIEDRQSG